MKFYVTYLFLLAATLAGFSAAILVNLNAHPLFTAGLGGIGTLFLGLGIKAAVEFLKKRS